MPEYLAPGVFVEEVSFRAKSIEGVSTSTTGFVGPTRRGPVARPDSTGRPPDTLEVLTSFLDFQRLYGGFEDLVFTGEGRTPNYIAHAVRAYFDNGGSRLYVARVFAGDGGRAASAVLTDTARFEARTPGACGNGTLRVSLRGDPVTQAALSRAPAGSVIRTGTRLPRASGGRITGGRPPFSVPQDGQLLLRVGTADVDLRFHGEPAEVTGGALADDVTLGENNVLTVVIDGRTSVITLPEASTPRGTLLDLINRNLIGGYARLDEANTLIIGSDVFGTSSDVQVMSSSAGAELGFAGDPRRRGTDIPENNVGDRRALGVADLNALFAAAGAGVTAGTNEAGELVLTNDTVGATPDAAIAVRVPGTPPPGGPLVHGLLGFADTASGAGTAGGTVTYYVRGSDGTFRDASDTVLPGNADTLGIELVTVTVVATDLDGVEKTYEGMGVHPDHPRYIGTVMALNPTRRSDQLEQLFAFNPGATPPAPLALLTALENNASIPLTGGHDGTRPTATDYATALASLAAIEDISIVAAPGSSADDANRQGVHNALVSHCEARRAYRIAVLDTRRISTIGEARDDRAPLDSSYAALYTPWVIVPNPLYKEGDESRPREIALPPSGFVCGIYARTDVLRGVFKAPANEVVRGALRYDLDINFAQQETLNPIGVNCLRFFPNRGNRVWGARTTSSDPEWKYVPVRRYFNYLERSIDVGTQWAVFEPNGERLWANVREAVASFLVNEWRSGALLGANPKEAFFVRCDRSTMDQNDLDNGRLVCLVGVAVVKPAEFVIFRVGQKTADARS
ncbi:MAG: phage tail sheath subtilisin-like domain-containing protein [Pseudomonadota bacterium]